MVTSHPVSPTPVATQPQVRPAQPLLMEFDGICAPESPSSLNDAGIDPAILIDLALKLACTRVQITTEYVVAQLCLSFPIVTELLEHLRVEQLIETLGQVGPLNYRFVVTGKGRERGAHLMSICAYVGPAPVSLDDYNRVLQWQLSRLPGTSAERVQQALSALVLPEEIARVAGLAVSSFRSLFLFGPPGNGKTTLGALLHQSLSGDLWVPRCIVVDQDIIRVYDPRCHQAVSQDAFSGAEHRIDRRWIRVRRPYIVVGGELSLESLDLIYDSARGYYEAPLHFKANGGIFLLDDLGCQRTDPLPLLNRWIMPLENQLDYLTLRTGQQIQVPFRQMLVVSTNMDPSQVVSPALLRRMGYRLYLGYPSEDDYTEIFRRHASARQLDVPPGLVDSLLQRYRAEERPIRSCEPRDLIQRAADICGYRGEPVQLTEEILAIAWTGYFGNERGIET